MIQAVSDIFNIPENEYLVELIGWTKSLKQHECNENLKKIQIFCCKHELVQLVDTFHTRT